VAMGYTDQRALGALRLTLGHSSTRADVDFALRCVPEAVARLRQEAPVTSALAGAG
jgi:cysteine desulfurase